MKRVLRGGGDRAEPARVLACSTEEGGGRKKMTGYREGKGEGKEMIFLEIFGRNSL